MLHKINIAFLPFAYCSHENFLILLSSDQLLSAGFLKKWHTGKVQNMLLPFIVIHEMTADSF